MKATTQSVIALVILALGCGGASETENEALPLPPPSEGGEHSEQRVDDGRLHFALPDDGSLGGLEGLLIRHRDEETPVERIVIHTARTAAAAARSAC